MITVHQINPVKQVQERKYDSFTSSTPTSAHPWTGITTSISNPFWAQDIPYVAGQLPAGAKIQIVGEGDGYYFVQFGNSREIGYYPMNTISILNHNYKVPKTLIVGETNSSGANLQEGPSSTSNWLWGIGPQQKVNIIGNSGNWFEIYYNGLIGYVKCNNVSLI